MTIEELKEREFTSEFIYSTSKSSGPGGQNVNKVNTKVELRFSIISTLLFSEMEKELIYKKLKNKINTEGEIVLVSQTERSQLQNKTAVTEKFFELVSRSLTIPEKRLATKPSYSSKMKRLEAKRIRGEVKKMRKEPGRSASDTL
jgi:ribosome-associated protein